MASTLTCKYCEIGLVLSFPGPAADGDLLRAECLECQRAYVYDPQLHAVRELPPVELAEVTRGVPHAATR